MSVVKGGKRSKVLTKKFEKFLKLRKNPKKERVQKYVELEPYIL